MKNIGKTLLVCVAFLSCKMLFSATDASRLVESKVYYISLDGDNSNKGTIESPWSTLEHAIYKVKGGEVIQFREGTYKIDLALKNFKTKNGLPVTIEAYPNEKVVFERLRSIDSDWKLWKNGIYRTKVKQSFWQLFVDRDLSDMARWPNTSFKNDSIWRMTQSMRSIDGGFRNGKYTGKSRYGLVYDKNFDTGEAKGFQEGDSRYDVVLDAETLAETNIDFTGAYAVLNIGNWLTWTREITEHKAGQGSFHYDTNGIKEQELKSHGAYYIYGLAALDKVNEWWYDKDEKYLYFKPVSKEQLKQHRFQVRDQDFSLNFKYCKDITVKGIHFFATGFFSLGSDRISFIDCTFDYMSTNKFVLGQTNWFTRFNDGGDELNKTSSIFKGSDCKFINCTVSNSNAPLFF